MSFRFLFSKFKLHKCSHSSKRARFGEAFFVFWLINFGEIPNGFHDDIYAFFTLSDTLLFLFALTFTFPSDAPLYRSKREGLNAFHPDEFEERKLDSFLRLVYMKRQLVKAPTVFNYRGSGIREVLGSWGWLRLRYSVRTMLFAPSSHSRAVFSPRAFAKR